MARYGNKRRSVARRPGTSLLRYAPAVARGLMSRYRSGGSSTSTKQRTRSEMAPLTNQNDVRTVYRKRAMPRGKKRRYVKQVKRFQSNIMRGLPSRIYTSVHPQSIVWVNDTSRYFGAFMGLCANNFYDNNFGELYDNIHQGTTADAKAEMMKLRVDSMSLSVVIRNTSEIIGGESGIVDLDVYKVAFQRDVPQALWGSVIGIESFLATEKNRMRQPQGMDIEVSDTGTAIATAQQNAGTSSGAQVVGDQLWNNPGALKYVKVLKQWKVQISRGQVVHFNMRSSRNKIITRTDCFGNTALAAKKWLTQGYIFNANGRLNIASPSYFEDGSLVVEQYVRYNCKVMPGISPTLVTDLPFS